MSHADLAELELGVAIPRRRFARRRFITVHEGTPVRVAFTGGGAMVGALKWVSTDAIAVEMNGGLCVVGTDQVTTVSPVD